MKMSINSEHKNYLQLHANNMSKEDINYMIGDLSTVIALAMSNTELVEEKSPDIVQAVSMFIGLYHQKRQIIDSLVLEERKKVVANETEDWDDEDIVVPKKFHKDLKICSDTVVQMALPESNEIILSQSETGKEKCNKDLVVTSTYVPNYFPRKQTNFSLIFRN